MVVELALGAGGALLLSESAALAQSNPASKDPPAAPIATIGRSSEGSLVTILLVLLLALAVIGVNFIPSKRGHQD